MNQPRASSKKHGRIWITLTFFLLAASVLPTGGMGSCNQSMCTSQSADYNALTSQCTGYAGGAYYPGSGGLPSEPGTAPPTGQPTTAPGSDDVDLNIFGLGGKWTDNGRAVCINHTGSGVFATYYQPDVCEHRDGTGDSDSTYTDFEATLSGKTLTGTTSVCGFGHDDHSLNGIRSADMTLTVSDDGRTLSGTWHNTEDNSDVPISLTRQTVGDCHAP
ncbi:MAG TPA: hypothetical protein VMV81_07375 [Phycisphaerae bacterium]|nr:hypothetical protein [Phycisphaerae bacterium]